MSLGDILPIILIIAFWAIMFVLVFTFWRMHTESSAPAEAERDAHGDGAARVRATSAH